jgi:predicted RNA-binding protein with EMAP domain
MRELKDLKFREVKLRFDEMLFHFIRDNTKEILEQLKADSDYHSQKTEVPKIPLFDDYLSKLEIEIKDSVTKIGYFNGTVKRLATEYRDVFYRSSLPNLAESHCLGSDSSR